MEVLLSWKHDKCERAVNNTEEDSNKTRAGRTGPHQALGLSLSSALILTPTPTLALAL